MLTMAKQKTAFPKHPFDVVHGTDTGGLTPGVELKTGHDHDRYNTAYYGIAPSLLRRFITQWRKLPPPHRLGSYNFIDVGAGKGRAMLLASEFPFREVVGVELNPDLARICRRNIRIWNASHEQAAPLRVSEGDATEFVFPPGPCLVYMFNPFGSIVVRRFLRTIEAQFADRKGDLDILYVNHESEAAIKGRAGFKQLWRGTVPMSSLDAIVDLQIINSQLDGEYGSTGDEACSIYRYQGLK